MTRSYYIKPVSISGNIGTAKRPTPITEIAQFRVYSSYSETDIEIIQKSFEIFASGIGDSNRLAIEHLEIHWLGIAKRCKFCFCHYKSKDNKPPICKNCTYLANKSYSVTFDEYPFPVKTDKEYDTRQINHMATILQFWKDVKHGNKKSEVYKCDDCDEYVTKSNYLPSMLKCRKCAGCENRSTMSDSIHFLRNEVATLKANQSLAIKEIKKTKIIIQSNHIAKWLPYKKYTIKGNINKYLKDIDFNIEDVRYIENLGSESTLKIKIYDIIKQDETILDSIIEATRNFSFKLSDEANMLINSCNILFDLEMRRKYTIENKNGVSEKYIFGLGEENNKKLLDDDTFLLNDEFFQNNPDIPNIPYMGELDPLTLSWDKQANVLPSGRINIGKIIALYNKSK